MRKPFSVLVSVITGLGLAAILAEGLMAGPMNWDVDHAQRFLANTFVILTVPSLLLVYFLLSLAQSDDSHTGRLWKALSIPALVFLVGIAHMSVGLGIWQTLAVTGISAWMAIKLFHAGHAAIPYRSSTRGFWALAIPFLMLDLITYEVQTSHQSNQLMMTAGGLFLFSLACGVSYWLTGQLRDHHHDAAPRLPGVYVKTNIKT